MDVDIKIGMNDDESCRIIQDLVEVEREVFDKFVGDNPEIMLPSDSELEIVFDSDPLINGPEKQSCRTPDYSLKESGSSEL
jgi:hypothetical protein